MIKIYKYHSEDKRFRDVVYDNTLKGKKREEAIVNWVKENGTEVSIKEFLNDNSRSGYGYHRYGEDYIVYRCFGNPENSIERLVYGEIEWDDDLGYWNARKHHPEDLIESRTDWDAMRNYADGLYYFIESLKSEIADGKIILA